MMGCLAEALQSFYKRQQGRIVFLNGATLNQLSLEMWEQLDCREIDASVLSKVINGKRLFSPHQLDVFCQLLSLKQHQKDSLWIALQEDYAHKFELDLFPSNDFLNLVNTEVKRIYRLRLAGGSYQAIEWLETARDLILKNFVKNRSFGGEKIYRILSRILVELNRNYADLTFPGKGLKRLYPQIRKQLRLAHQLKDKEALGFAYASFGDAYYVDKNYQLAARYFSQAARLIKDLNWKLESLRAQAISLAYLQEEREFNRTERVTREVINKQKVSKSIIYCSIFEGLGRGKALLNSAQAHEVLAEGYQNYQWGINQGEIVVFPKIQLARSNLLAACKLKINSFLSIKLGEEALVLAKAHGYDRHAGRIERLLNRLSN